jgi:predicted TIM-barrel fold metal-dependent hydrolase
MIVDCHVHIAACTPGHGHMSEKLLHSAAFRFMQWRFGISGASEFTERALEQKLVETIEQSPIDKAVVLAFDAAYTRDGAVDVANTHLYVTNSYVMQLTQAHPKMLFGASVHPYRRDAIEQLERCVAARAVLMKWLPIVQNFNPADEKCIPFYEALAHHKLPLLAHTGGEQSLPNLDKSVADPMLLKNALDRGVSVIMAHCGTRSAPWDTDYLPTFMRLARAYENCYGDTSALCLPTRSYAFKQILSDPIVRKKLIYGSDWPILPMPRVRSIGVASSWKLMREMNWMTRDYLIKKQLGFDDAYWNRAAKVLGIESRIPSSPPSPGVPGEGIRQLSAKF